MPAKRFPPPLLAQIDAARSLGVRSGDDHKHTNVWVVVIKGRVLVRSWNDKPTGWFRAFKKRPLGAIVLKGKLFRARGVPVRSAALIKAASDAYRLKYPHKGSRQYVDGFREPARQRATLELVPA